MITTSVHMENDTMCVDIAPHPCRDRYALVCIDIDSLSMMMTAAQARDIATRLIACADIVEPMEEDAP
jgi:hypothetical protein